MTPFARTQRAVRWHDSAVVCQHHLEGVQRYKGEQDTAMVDFLSDSTNRTRTTRLLLLAIIVLTIPCYCLGAVMLAYAPAQPTRTAPAPTNATLGALTLTPLATPTLTPFATWTATLPGGGLQATPGQLFLPTNTPFVFPATATPFPTVFIASPTLPPIPTLTLAPTLTLVPSDTPLPPPTATPLPPPTATEVPPPTEPPPPLPTEEPPPTQEVSQATPEQS